MKEPKVLLVYPECPETFWSFKYALKFISKKSSLPPLGLLTVAALLPKYWQVKLVDMNAGDKLRDKDILWADYVFVSAMIIQERSARKVIRWCKALGRRVVAGGPLFTLEAERFTEVDHLILGEAETNMYDFVRDVESSGNPQRIYESDGWANLEMSVTPDFHLIKSKLHKYATLGLQFSRGCPFDCEFCNIKSLLGCEYRVKSKARIICELDAIFQLGWRGGVFFVDDNFIGKRKYVKEIILPAIESWMKQRNYPFTFLTQVSVNIAEDPELMDAMARAGFDTVFIGIETPINESLEECHKIKNMNKNLVAEVQKIQRHGLEVQAGFIVGFDSDPLDVFERMADFIQASGIVTAMVGMLNAPMGTKLYERLEREGRIRGKMTGDNTDISTNIVPLMGFDVLKKGYMEVLEKIYSPQMFYERLDKFLDNFQPYLVKRHSLRPTRVLAGLRSVYRLGMFGRERKYYWSMAIRCLRKRPELFPLAVTLAIYGYHFRRVFENNFSHSK